MNRQTKSTIEPRIRRGDRRGAAAGAVLLVAFALGLIGVGGPLVFVDLVVAMTAAGGAGWLFWRRQSEGVGAPGGTGAGEALLALVAAFVLSRWSMTFGVELFGLVLLVVAWAVSTASRRTALALVGAVVAVEVAVLWTGAVPGALGPVALLDGAPVDGAPGDWAQLGVRLALVGAFAGMAWLLVGRRAQTERRHYEAQAEEQRKQLLAEAREFRLIHAGRSQSAISRRDAEELIVRDAVDAVHHTVFVTLELVKTALNAHTVVLLWFDLKNEKLRIKELVSDSDNLVEGAIDPAGGVIGGISRKRDGMRLSGLRPGFRGLAYYRQAEDVSEFIGVPVIEQGHLRGVLCVDRNARRPFDDGEQRVVEEAAAYVMRAVENERMVATIERTRFEVSRFYEASRQLNGVLTPEEAYRVALESVRQIADYDVAALTLYDEDDDCHQVVLADGPATAAIYDADWTELEFSSNQGLASMVVRNRHYLPVGGRLRDPKATVLSKELDFSAIQSLLVLPLIAQDKPVGTMVVGHRQSGQFPAQRREMLEVIANQVAVTMQNARLYAQMESMAKFDALTGLANRRSFESRLSETMARHKRAGRTFGLVLTDIDHFKGVNDTYGHPVGDEVLRQVGRVFREGMREVDMPARYGGEEFVLILEDTDLEGARQVADRLREAIGELEFQTDQGLLQCTISMGIAMGPWDSDEPHELVDLADQALYHSKENGRNQVSIYREVIASGAAA